MSALSERNLSLDVIKTLAMFGVMCLHTQIQYYDNPIARFMYMTAVVSIPLFFMTSGYLMFGKTSVDYKYSIRKMLGILRFVAIVTIVYWIVIARRHGSSFLNTTLGSLLQRGGMGVFWYFGAMLIIYALLPILYRMYTLHPKMFQVFTATLGISSVGIFCLNFIGLNIEQHTIQNFRMWNWLFYFCLGGVVRRHSFKINGYIVLLLFIANYLLQYYLTPLMPNKYCEYFYPCLLTMFLVFATFVWGIGLKLNKLIIILSWGGGGDVFFLATHCTYSS